MKEGTLRIKISKDERAVVPNMKKINAETNDKKFHGCGKTGHYLKVCLSSRSRAKSANQPKEQCDSSVHVGLINKAPTVVVQISNIHAKKLGQSEVLMDTSIADGRFL